ncbi:hypothetical protein BC826DRAFT_656457 [Russula brevipes]|nr:hypothetical protein BC826DRAFT_656457 [Russula brevipes]
MIAQSGVPSSSVSFDNIAPPAATALTISAGNPEWLHGRYWSSNWDIREGEIDWKEKTLKQNGLVNKLFIPPSLKPEVTVCIAFELEEPASSDRPMGLRLNGSLR